MQLTRQHSYEDADLADIDRVARQYTGSPYPLTRPPPRQRLGRNRRLARLGRAQRQEPARVNQHFNTCFRNQAAQWHTAS